MGFHHKAKFWESMIKKIKPVACMFLKTDKNRRGVYGLKTKEEKGVDFLLVLYKPKGEKPENLKFMRLMDEQYLKTPCYGSRSMVTFLERLGYDNNRKRIQRLMRLMGLEAIYALANSVTRPRIRLHNTVTVATQLPRHYPADPALLF